MRASPRVRLVALALVALSVALMIFAREPRASSDGTSEVEPAADRGEPRLREALGEGAAPAPLELASSADRLAEPEAEPPRSLTPTSRPPVDPCADAEGDPPIERPSLGTLISERVAELNDRMQRALRREGSSDTLRQGLRAATEPAEADRALALLASAPDRVEDGFDLRVAVLVVLAANALGTDDPSRARALARTAVREAPTDPLPLALLAVADERLHDAAAAADALTRAFALAPDEPSIAVALSRHLRDGPDPAAAVRVLDAYLREVPTDAAQLRTRERLRRRAAALTGHRTTSRHGVTIVAPRDTTRSALDMALDAVDAALTRSASLLGVERPTAIAVLVYPTPELMREATCGRVWSTAMYDGALHVSADSVGTLEGTLALRHESLHATLHRGLPAVNVPTWLDEGLAQYASGEADVDRGIAHSFRLMVDAHAIIPLPSMNGAFLVIDDPTDARLAYHQALAMVLWLVDRRGERGVADAIEHLRSGGDPTRVLETAARAPLDAETLRAFLASRPAAH